MSKKNFKKAIKNKNTQVISEKEQKSGVFDIFKCVQEFLALTIFWVNFFALFLTALNSASNFAFYGTHIKFFQRKGPFCQQKWNFFTFITVSKSFRPVRFLSEFFALVSTDLNSASNFAFYGTHIKFIKKAPFSQKKSKSLYPNGQICVQPRAIQPPITA